MVELTASDLRTSLLAFARYTLGFELYDWQKDAINPFDAISWRMVQVTLATPNESGKAQPTDEPVLTPGGWREIGSLQVGDEIITGDGTVTRVCGVFPQGAKEVLRVTFQDGAWTRCCAEHLWTMQSAWQRNPGTKWIGKWQVRSTAEAMARPRLHRYIPVVGAVHHPGEKLPIDPYTLGVLLGDGCLKPSAATVCTHPDTFDLCRWPEGIVTAIRDERGPVKTWSITDSTPCGRESRFLQAIRALELDDCRAWEKFVPEIYLRTTPERRLAILHGLLDTDGTHGVKAGSTEFNTTSPQLAADVIELVRSLGGTATMSTRIPTFTHKGEKKHGRMDHRVRINLPVCPFRVERKSLTWKPARHFLPCRIMESAEFDGIAECVCIAVEHPSKTYVTRNHIVTHNSSVVIPTVVLGLLALYPKIRIVLTTADGKQLDNQVMPAIDLHRAKFPGWKFNERQITTPTGGRFVAFTTDDPGRAEGWQPVNDLDGPLVIIVDEAKTVEDKIFSAFDRCGYSGLLLTSSPGKMSGMFYESQFNPKLDFIRLRVGLKDCPHIDREKIERIIAKYGASSPFTRSALHGEFLESFDGKPVYYAYNQDEHEDEDLPWPIGAYLVRGHDVGTHAATTWSAYWQEGGIEYWHTLYEFYASGFDADRHAREVIRITENEFEFYNDRGVCAGVLDYVDPAAQNSSYTRQINVDGKDVKESALNIFRSYGIYPGFTTHARGLQETIAIVNRLLESRNINGVPVFRVDKKHCPRLVRGFRGGYRWPTDAEKAGENMPLKGPACEHLDHGLDALRYSAVNALRLSKSDVVAVNPHKPWNRPRKSANPMRRV